MLSKILFGILVAVLGVTYFLYQSNETLRQNNAVLESAAKTNQETIAQLQKDAKLMNELNAELVSKFNEADKKVDELRDKFIDHDLTKLSLKKPGLIEKRINNGTQKAFDHIESITAIGVQPADTGTEGSGGNENDKAGNTN